MKLGTLLATSAFCLAAMATAANAGPWMRMGTERFTWRADSSIQPAYFHGNSVDRIRLKPLDDDAGCRWLQVRFANGKSQVAQPGRIRQGDSFVMELKGREGRNIDSVRLTCRAVGARDVQISIESQRDDGRGDRPGRWR